MSQDVDVTVPENGGLREYDQPGIGDFVLYAEQRLSLGGGNRVTGGHLGIRSVAVEQAGGQLVTGAGSVIDQGRVIVAPSVAFGNDVTTGTLLADAVTGPSAAKRPERPFPASLMPLLPLAAAPAAGTENVRVATGQTQSLVPGSYGALIVDGSLILEP